MTQKIIVDTIIVEEMAMSLLELSQACGVHTKYIIELVSEGILDPVIDNENDNKSDNIMEGQKQWYFTGNSLRRVHMSLRLQRDLELNLPGIALILDILEERGRSH